MIAPPAPPPAPASTLLSGMAELAVLLAENIAQPFTYQLEAGSQVVAGQLVQVPFGKRQVYGVVLGQAALAADFDRARLKPIGQILPVPPLPPTLLGFVAAMADYCMVNQGAVLGMVLGGSKTLEPIKRLKTAPGPPPPAALHPQLSPAQAEAAAALCEKVHKNGFSTTLLDGVTGSGKTEVYCEAIAAALAQGKQALLLLPEIALTTQIVSRLGQRFGFDASQTPLLWHSQQSLGTRKQLWRGIAEGSTQLVIGARSALFLPFARLGIIVVDEEHEASYKQEEGVIYHARDMAVLRAKHEHIPIILSSATPSLETMVNVHQGRYHAVHLPERHGVATPPTIQLIDLKAEKLSPKNWLSPTLLQAMRETLARGEQTLLYLNRRGYAPLTLCRQCGGKLGCPQCSAWLVEHRQQGKHRLLCHHCDYAVAYPSTCPHCHTEGKLAACGPGIERLDEEVARHFPQASRAILASDNQNNLRAMQGVVAGMESGATHILIGTQMSAKGYHFPQLTLVGVVDGDLGLQGGDLRAAERTFQMLYQVAGRSGRAAAAGRVYIQTVQPRHGVMQCLSQHNRSRLIATLIAEREKYHMPPFGRLATLTLSGTETAKVATVAAALASKIPTHATITVLGPAPAPLALLRGRHRIRFLLQSDKRTPLQPFIRHWLTQVKIPATIRLAVDVDPQSFG